LSQAPEPARRSHLLAGRIERPVFESSALTGNRVGDPHAREVPIYLPPGHDAPGAQFPVLFMLCGFTGNGTGYLEQHPWWPGVVPLFDQAVQRGEVPPAILVLPNCFTLFGGSQYVNSSYLGSYEDYVADELVAFVDERCPTLPGRRGVLGKSSGGFGALHLAMRHPETFPVAASLSGDCHFELCHAPHFLACLRGLVPHGGDPARFLEQFIARPDLSGHGHDVINTLAMAACYSPNPGSALGFDLPMDLRTGARVDAVWQRWLEFDPLYAAERYVENLRALELLHVECGVMDEYNLQFGLRALSDRLRELGVAHAHEEHPGTHRGIDHRYQALFPKLIAALSR
jgi:S-formylglutathione hydrolase FrmB